MRTVSLGQILVFVLICFLLFGDITKLKKRLKPLIKQISIFFKNQNDRKKRI